MAAETESSSPLTSTELIDALRAAQIDLQSSAGISRVEISYNQLKFSDFKSRFVDLSLKLKRHYIMMYLLFNFYRTRRPIVQSLWSCVASSLECKPYTESIPEYITLVGYFRDLSVGEFVDGLTFGVIPAYCSFFFTEFGVSAYMSVLDTVKDTPAVYDAIARGAFFSPLFLNFITVVFSPFLPQLLSHTAKIPIEYIQVHITQHWTESFSVLPEVVIMALNHSTDPCRTLSASFFELALSQDGAKIFSLIEFYQTMSKQLLDALSTLLTFKSSKNILRHLLPPSTQSGLLALRLLSGKDAAAFRGLLEHRVISSMDLALLNALTQPGKRKKFSLPDKYEVFVVERSMPAWDTRTRVSPVLPSSASLPLARLLQACDAIPKFESAPALSERAFVQSFLVQRGPWATLPLREVLARQLTSDLRELCAGVAAHNDAHIRSSSLLTRFTDQLRKAADDAGPVVQVTLRHFTAVRMDFAGASNAWKADLKRYASEVTRLEGDFVRFIEKYPAEITGLPESKEIVYAYLTKDFDFSRFRIARNEQLGTHDCRMEELLKLERSRDMLLDQIFVMAQDGKKSEVMENLKELIKTKLSKEVDVLTLIERGFSESSPLRKINLIWQGMIRAVEFCKEVFPPTEDIGANQTIPIFQALFIIAKPPALLCNFVYLHDFCHPYHYLGMFDKFQDMFSAFHVVINLCLPKLPLKTFFSLQDPNDTWSEVTEWA
jgi:hypothetical protein